jgi:hypothetical protein
MVQSGSFVGIVEAILQTFEAGKRKTFGSKVWMNSLEPHYHKRQIIE